MQIDYTTIIVQISISETRDARIYWSFNSYGSVYVERWEREEER